MPQHQEQTFITLPSPTPNSGLHVGHISGPYLAGDVYAKALKLRDCKVSTLSYSDAAQSYVRVSARQQNREPEEFSRYWTSKIKRTLGEFHIHMDQFYYPEKDATEFIGCVLLELLDSGIFIEKEFPFFVSRETGEIFDEAGVNGICPNCTASCKCGICEACGLVNNASNLLYAKSALDPKDGLSVKMVRVIVLETEKYREALISFYSKNRHLRPRYEWMVRDLLEKVLPDFPVSVPSAWGTPVGRAGYDGQCFNAWAEVIAQFIFCFETEENRTGISDVKTNIINFLGYDNSIYFATFFIVILSHYKNGKWLPSSAMINEFYNLDHKKFSASANHAIWADDLLERHSADAIRFHLCLTGPGFAKANFDEAELSSSISERFINPLHRILKIHNSLDYANNRQPNLQFRELGDIACNRVLRSLTLERFNLQQAAEDVLIFLETFGNVLERSKDSVSRQDIQYLLLKLAVCASPMMPEAMGKLHKSLSGSNEITIKSDLSQIEDNLSFEFS